MLEAVSGCLIREGSIVRNREAMPNTTVRHLQKCPYNVLRFTQDGIMSAASQGKVVETEFHVRYAETDAMGVVHHATYLVYFEEGRS